MANTQLALKHLHLMAGALLACLLGAASQAAAPAQSPARKQVYCTSYPLAYVAQRLAGDRLDVVFPAPKGEDPAFWNPGRAIKRRYQTADLILLNGADFEKWVSVTTLPRARMVDTSIAFANQWLQVPEAVTHSHGPQGPHSHAGVDFNTWLDPQLFQRQADAVEAALARLLPDAAPELRRRNEELRRDLGALDAALRKASEPLRGQPMLASHPVYNYLARRYGWDLKSVHWEPGADVPADQWKDFDTLLARHPARIMLWEAEPLPQVKRALEQRGVRVVVFDTCANRPENGDYLEVMQRNTERLREAGAQSPEPKKP